MKNVNIAVLAFLCTGWTVSHERDKMTDKQLTWASASSGDATLLFGCMNGEGIWLGYRRDLASGRGTDANGDGRAILAGWPDAVPVGLVGAVTDQSEAAAR